jgi:hypothetical protein
MDILHRVIGFATLGGAGLGVIGAAWLAFRPAALDRRYLAWLGYVVVGLAVLGAATGAFRQTSGGTPASLHPIFAALAVVTIPVAAYLGPLFRERVAWAWLVAFAVTGLAVLGLFGTG